MAFPQDDSYRILSDLSLPNPSKYQLHEKHKARALSLQQDIRALRDRDLSELERPLTSLADSYDDFKDRENRYWGGTGQRPASGDTFVSPSGSFEAPLAHHLHQPSYVTNHPQRDGETADMSNASTAIVIGNLYRPDTLLFDHLHRRCRESRGLVRLPTQVLKCHEDYTRDICESMLAKVELIHGDKIHLRTFADYEFTPLSLWGPFEGVVLFLAHEENFRNADARYKFRRIRLLVAHPQHLMYESKDSPRSSLHGLIHKAASKMTGVNVKELYLRQQQWKAQLNHPHIPAALYKKNTVSNAYTKSTIVEEPENEMPDYQVDEKLEKGTIKTCLQKDMGGSKLPPEMKCVCIHCYENNPPDLAQLLFDSKARWTLHLYRPLYVERNKLCPTCKQFRRFVPVDTEVPSMEQKYLRNAAQKYLQFDDDSKGMLLDHLAPSNRRPRFGKGTSAQASTAQKSSDKGIYAALASTLKSPIALEAANRNPSEIEKGKCRKRKKSALSVWSEQWPLRGAEQDHQDRLRRPQRNHWTSLTQTAIVGHADGDIVGATESRNGAVLRLCHAEDTGGAGRLFASTKIALFKLWLTFGGAC